jgi:hypothetical protein
VSLSRFLLILLGSSKLKKVSDGYGRSYRAHAKTRDHHFAAVAADNTSVELRPTMASWNIHDYLLPMWGTPVGELFDLEPLSQMCQKLGRYSFFVTSAPLNVMRGIACKFSV